MTPEKGSWMLGFLVILMLGLSCYVFFFLPGGEQPQKQQTSPSSSIQQARQPAPKSVQPSLSGIFPHLTRESVIAYFQALAESSSPELQITVHEYSGKVDLDIITVRGEHIVGNSFQLDAYIYKGTSKVAWVKANGLFVVAPENQREAQRLANTVYRLLLDLVVKGTPVESQARQWVKANIPRIRRGKPLSREFGKLKIEIYGNPPYAYDMEIEPSGLEAHLAEQLMKEFEMSK